MSSAMPKLQRTQNYAQFAMTKENREVNFLEMRSEHKRLRESMQRYGFLPSHPIHVRAVNGKFVVIDGQHRLAFAKELGLEVYFVVDVTEVDIAEINRAQAGWRTIDYAKKWANVGRKDYTVVIDYHNKYGIPIGYAFAIHAGTICHFNIASRLHSGEFRITDAERAERIGKMFQAICTHARGMKDANLVNALYAVTFIEEFDDERIVEAAEKRPHLFSKQPTRDAYLQLIEEVYNFFRKVRTPVRFEAEQVMRQRNELAHSKKKRPA